MKLSKVIKTISIAAIASSLLSCSKNPPAPPDIKYHYSIISAKSATLCVRSEIVSFNPYTIAESKKVEFGECSNLEGYRVEDAKKLYNWMSDVSDWAEAQKIK